MNFRPLIPSLISYGGELYPGAFDYSQKKRAPSDNINTTNGGLFTDLGNVYSNVMEPVNTAVGMVTQPTIGAVQNVLGTNIPSNVIGMLPDELSRLLGF
jgi:hypothetical protein